jgi:hypothetical protein
MEEGEDVSDDDQVSTNFSLLSHCIFFVQISSCWHELQVECCFYCADCDHCSSFQRAPLVGPRAEWCHCYPLSTFNDGVVCHDLGEGTKVVNVQWRVADLEKVPRWAACNLEARARGEQGGKLRSGKCSGAGR